MSARLSPQREAETFASMDDRGVPEPSDAEEKRARLFGAVEAGATEGDLPTFAAALNDYLAAELAAIRAERDRALAVLERTQNRNADLAAERDELTRRDITAPLAVILRHGDMSQTVRQEIRNLLADAEARS